MTSNKIQMEFRRGITREVVVWGKWAFKFPSVRSWRLFLTGLLANLNEKQWSNYAPDRLCPVVFSLPGGFLNIMPRVAVWSTTLPDAQWEDLFADLPWVENKPYHFGRYKGNIVTIDYG